MFKNKKLKRVSSLLLCLCFTFSLTGCEIVPSLKLTESESHIIAEYAAGLLLKYDRNYSGNLKDLPEKEDELEIVHEREPIAEEPETADETYTDDGSSDEKKSKGEAKYSDVSMAEALGLDGFEVTFTAMEPHYIYPEESDEMVFSMQAQQGMELLVMHFNLTNTSDSEKMCNVLRRDLMFRVILNGSERVAGQHTILLNDLGQYHENVAGYGMVDTVLIFEVAEGTTQGIESLDLIINRDKTNYTYKIL